jgi:uncharacterized protein
VLLAIPTTLYLIALAIFAATVGTAPPAGEGGGLPAQLLKFFEAIGTGGVYDAFIGNLVFLAGRWGDLFATMRFPKVLGMFVLGLWTVRVGLALDPSRYKATLVRWATLGWIIGLPANVIATFAFERWQYLPPSLGGLLGVVMQAIGVPLLAIGYASSVALLVSLGVRPIRVFGPVGRMALTNYLMHSIICVTISYGFGMALWWRTGAAKALAIAAMVILVQIPLSALWLSKFRFGPVEWVWRRLTYRHAL